VTEFTHTTTPLRMLAIDDSDDDFVFAKRVLDRGGYAVTAKRVCTASELASALDETWDVILVDWRMPAWTGLEALELVLARDPGTPCIVVSGAASEEVVVEALRAGALDFISKDKVRSRLVPAVQRAGREHEAARELERSKAQAVESETRFRAMADHAPVMLWMAGPDAECDYFNRVWTEFTGRTLEQELGVGWAESVHFEDFQRCIGIYLAAFVKREPFRMEYRMRRADGEFRWILDSGVPRFGPDKTFAGFIGSCIDITEIREARETLQRAHDELDKRVRERTAALASSLKEKEVLLREIHHRVKNNLQLVSSLLNMQGRQLVDEHFKDALAECQGRVQAIALIHERLYRSKDLAFVQFGEYVQSLAGDVFHATGYSPGAIALEIAIDDISLPVDRAIPCGLVLNELITNAVKHAFPGGAGGTLRVGLARTAPGRVKLVVADNGKGLPAGFDIQTATTLGMQLVATLAEQLDAALEVHGHGGVTVTLEFDTHL
jgi:PAS domain S-box-containing protein